MRVSPLVAGALAVSALPAGASETAHRFAAELAAAGPRPAGSPAERRAQDRVAARFRRSGMRVEVDRFRVPGIGTSRNVIGVRRGSRRCLRIVMAHADTVPASPGANDNASGVGILVALAGRLRDRAPACEVWLVATGAEERPYTGARDHLGALALVRRVRARNATARLRHALSLDEVGVGRSFVLRSPVARPRSGVERELLAVARRERVQVAWRQDEGSGNSDHREFELFGLPAMKLGGGDDACHHNPCDRARRLSRVALGRAERLAAALLARR